MAPPAITKRRLRKWQRSLFLHKAISENICIIVDATRCTGNQVIVAIQATVNKNPKARATNGLYLRTTNIFQSPVPPRCC